MDYIKFDLQMFDGSYTVNADGSVTVSTGAWSDVVEAMATYDNVKISKTITDFTGVTTETYATSAGGSIANAAVVEITAGKTVTYIGGAEGDEKAIFNVSSGNVLFKSGHINVDYYTTADLELIKASGGAVAMAAGWDMDYYNDTKADNSSLLVVRNNANAYIALSGFFSTKS